MAGPRAAESINLELLPGVVSNAADRDAMGRWTDANYVRWHKGLAEKIGGSQRQTLTGSNGGVYLGQGRTILDWSSLDGQKWIAIGSHSKLYIVNNNTLYDITPIRKTSAATDPIATTNASAVVTITDADHRAEPGNYVNIFSAAAVGGLTLSGNYQIVTVTGPNTYTINAGTSASSTASGGGAVTFEYEIYSGYATNTARFGYGTGTYGTGTYGTPRTSGSGIPVRLRTWSLDQWGEDLVACPSGGPLYWWDRTTGPNARAVIRPDAPSAIQRILVNPENRFLIALGATGLDGVPDPMRVRWPTQETFDDWTPTVNNSAGGKRLDYGSRIVTGLKSRSQNFIWSDTHMYAMEFVGPSLYFGFQPLGTVKIVGPNAAVDVNGVIFMKGFDDYYVYDGTLRVLDCDVWTKVFGDPKASTTGDFDRTQAEMVHCSHYATKNEVRWDYRSVGASDCDRCVIYNYKENCWYHHVQARTAYSNVNEALTGAVTNPFAINAGKLYKQEIGTDEIDGSALTIPAWYLQSYDNHVGGSDAVMLIHSITPNFDRLSGSMEMRLRAKAYPREPSYRDKGPYTITPATLDMNVRQKGSQVALRLSSDGRPGEDFRLGKFQVSASRYGGRTGTDTVTLATVTPPVLSGEIVGEGETIAIVAGVGAINDVGVIGYADTSVAGENIGSVNGTLLGYTVLGVWSDEFDDFVLVLQGGSVPADDAFDSITVENDNAPVLLEAVNALTGTNGMPANAKYWRWFSDTIAFTDTQSYDISSP